MKKKTFIIQNNITNLIMLCCSLIKQKFHSIDKWVLIMQKMVIKFDD